MRSKLENRLATMENNHDKLVKANAKLKSTHDLLVQTQKQISTIMEEKACLPEVLSHYTICKLQTKSPVELFSFSVSSIGCSTL